MKLATFRLPTAEVHVGVVIDGESLVDLTLADKTLFPDMLTLIAGGERALEAAASHAGRRTNQRALGDVRLEAPIPLPPKLRDFLCFEKHFRQSRANRYLFGIGTARLDPATVELPKEWYRGPVGYKCNCHSVVGSGHDVVWPEYSQVIDYEFELGIVVGKTGVDVPTKDALAHVFGYTIFNDFSARDEQYREMAVGFGPSKGKDFDTGNGLGPWIVTTDEIPDLQDLTMITRINGEEWARGNAGEMRHKVRDVVSYASRGETLIPGEVLGTGTVGNGCGNELGRFLKHGDIVELEAVGIGTLRNRIVAPHVPVPPTLPYHLGL